MGHWGLLGGVEVFRGCKGCHRCIGAGRECRYSGARRDLGDLRGHWGLLGV